MKNNDFSTQDHWFSKKGEQGDNATIDSNIESGQADFKVLGESLNYTLYGIPNSTDSPDWYEFAKPLYYLPDNTAINTQGCRVSHVWSEGSNQFPGVHWRKNISLQEDMSEYNITSASIDVKFNASVSTDLEVLGEGAVNQYGIGDFVTFYVLISDLNFTNPYIVARNKTYDLGRDSGPTSISDKLIEIFSEDVLITALNSAFEKDPSHSNFTITLGMDLYAEDNWGGDTDTFTELYIKDCNLTFTYERKIDKFTSISWNQIGNNITGSNVRITNANLSFQYKIDQQWPTQLSPFSEIRILINNNLYAETIRLNTANLTFGDAKKGGFDVTNMILKGDNITLSIQVFIANTFGFGENISISIDDVHLTITYVETFPDILTVHNLILNGENKTADPYIQIPISRNLNITLQYLENQTLNHIDGATVQLEGKESGQLTENASFGQYTIIINTSKLDIGLWPLSIIAQRNNYTTQTIPFYVNVIEKPTDFKIFVDTVEKTNNNSVKIKYNEFMNISILYKDNSSKQHLSGANVSISGIGSFDELNEQFNFTLNSITLGLGFHVLSINAQLQNYTTQTFKLYVEVFNRATNLSLLVNGTQRFNGNIIQLEVYQYLNLTIFYLDDILKTHLSGAVISILGLGNFSEIGSQYNYTLNSLDLNLGFNVINIYAQLSTFETQTVQFYIEVFERKSEMQLLINNLVKKDSDTIEVEVNQFLNITIFYNDNLTKLHLSGATVELIGWGNFSEVSSQYNYTIDSNDLEEGITVFTIQAQIANYETQTIQFNVKMLERDTELQLFIDDIQTNASDTVKVDMNQFLNISILYKDNLTKQHLSGATVELIDWGAFSEIGSQYNYTIDTNDLGQSITILAIKAHLTNYKTQIIQFNVDVSERGSKIHLLLDNENKTTDPVFEVTIGSLINITIKYLDVLTNNHISGGSVQIRNNTYTNNFTEISTFNQYSLYFNTSNLKIGVNLFTIVAQATNFQIQTINLRITINKIMVAVDLITGEPFMNILYGEGINISVILNNTDFGGTIKNATVIYRWAYGQGQLQDLDNDGIYGVLIEDIPIGTYIITITVSGFENYDFESYEITLSVLQEGKGEDLTWLVYVLLGVIVGAVCGFTAYQMHFKYPPMVRKIRKLRKKIRKDKKSKPIVTQKRSDFIDKKIQDSSNVLETEFSKVNTDSEVSGSKIINKIEKLDKILEESD
jgi:hypothetical protein